MAEGGGERPTSSSLERRKFNPRVGRIFRRQGEENLLCGPMMEGQEEDPMTELEQLSICEEDLVRFKDDRKHLLDIFPEELWLLIFEAVEDPSDLENLSNSSLYFRSLLLSQRCTRLFPRVWDILVGRGVERALVVKDKLQERLKANNWMYNAVGEPVPGATICTECGLTRETRYFSGILLLRLVCREWSRTLDSFYLNKAQNIMQGGLGELWVEDAIQTKAYFDSLNNQPGQFLRHFWKSHGSSRDRSPFIQRTVILCIGPADDGPEEFPDHPPENYFPDMLTLLSNCGHHIWYCNIIFCDDQQQLSVADAYMILHEHLKRLPNVRFLTIRFNDYQFDFSVERMEELEEAIRTHPAPTFPQLEGLSLRTRVLAIDRAVLRANTHTRSFENEGEFDPEHVPMQNLREIALAFRAPHDFRSFIAAPTAFQLTKMVWKFYGPSESSWQEIFNGLEEKGSETLTTVMLELPQISDENMQRFKEDWGSFQLRLPHVTHLNVTLHDVAPLDFILPLRDTLKELKVKCFFPNRTSANLIRGATREAEAGAVLKILGAANDFLEEGNVFEHLPCLERVNLYVGDYIDFIQDRFGDFHRTYRRDEWMRRRNE